MVACLASGQAQKFPRRLLDHMGYIFCLLVLAARPVSELPLTNILCIFLGLVTQIVDGGADVRSLTLLAFRVVRVDLGHFFVGRVVVEGDVDFFFGGGCDDVDLVSCVLELPI